MNLVLLQHRIQLYENTSEPETPLCYRLLKKLSEKFLKSLDDRLSPVERSTNYEPLCIEFPKINIITQIAKLKPDEITYEMYLIYCVNLFSRYIGNV